ncbi:PREDICTED: uncharacterized protein LOC104823154 [Tarenaya hassleriana]|uniref:uncharacterized protein LOC104823154 n=1 Tax=Tarenaya hassleriana TaxID=28532 RepID=UPI00053C90AF|nr:PREDICTED: uncharacterized protein LOC104823154 [Tarenaya hassleriana]
MVVKMRIMRWPPWPPLSAAKFEVIVAVHRMDGLDTARFDGDEEGCGDRSHRRPRKGPVVEIKWKGQKTVALKRSVARNFTGEGGCGGDGVVEWNEEFTRLCEFSVYKEGLFLPWEVILTVFNGTSQVSKDKVPIIGKASLNIAELCSPFQEDDVQVKLPLKISGTPSGLSPCLHISLRFIPKGTSPERQRSVLPVLWSPSSVEAPSSQKPESSVKAGLRKMKTFNHCMSTGWGVKKENARDGTSDSESKSKSKSPDRNLYSESSDLFTTDSLDDDAEDDSEESREDVSAFDPVSYKTLPYANWARGSFHSGINPEDEDLIYYSHRRSENGHSHDENSTDTAGSEQLSSGQLSKKRMLSWKKRKLSFRSPKRKGELLLKKDCREEGGDDIDFDRRQLNSSDESISEWYKSNGSITKPSSESEFGDENFVVGSWETKGIISRDGMMKLMARVFFASIDQRSERAAGESACTALVAVIAHWLQSNKDVMPTKSEFDSLIREGSSEWRNLCENEEYRERFPDKHFDLDTVLQAKIRPICVIPEKSFIGFFHPEKSDEEGEGEGEGEVGLDFLHGVMSFDSIWEEIIKKEQDSTTGNEPVVYIVSWNDHFFILLIDKDAYYIIDTLGERLYEGCNQAYVLKFDKETEIQRLPDKDKNASPSNQKPICKNKSETPEKPAESSSSSSSSEETEQREIVCRGKESCREYIKSFLAAIPIRQLKADMKKGLVSSFHHRLQIELHYTGNLHQPMTESSDKVETETAEAGTVTEAMSEVAAAASVPVAVA